MMDKPPSSYALETTGVSKQFKTVKALDSVSLKVPENSIFGFLGPNGAGKSTLIRIITGLIKASEGSFSIFGRGNQLGHKVRTEMGALVDRADFYKNISAYQNLSMLGRMTGHNQKDHIDHLLNVVGLYERRSDAVKTYSQGMKQRLGLAQALLPQPRILILDEPTTGLDPVGMREVRDFILKIHEEEKVTIFLSSHLLHEVEDICSDIALIFNGQLAAQGGLNDIFQNLEKVQVTLETDEDSKLLGFLEGSDLVQSVSPSARGFKVRIAYRDIPKLNQQITAAGISLYSIAQRNRLEEFFISAAAGEQE